MSAEVPSNVLSYLFSIGTALFFAALVAFVVYMLISRKNTVPFAPSGKEGFQGPSQGVSDFPCGQESADAIAVAEMFYGRKSSTEEGVPDLVELKQILSKMCCMKHDLMSAAQVVQASLYLPYSNTHDRENPADTVGRCFTKGIPPRDLDITFATWKDRGVRLLNKLCTSYDFTAVEADKAQGHFMKCWGDCYDVAQTVCLKQDKIPEGSPRDPKGVMPEAVSTLGSYKGYY